MAGQHRIALASATRSGARPKSALSNSKIGKVTGSEKQPIKGKKK